MTKATRFASVLAAAAALALGGATTAIADRDHPEDGPSGEAAQSGAALRHIDGTVLSKNGESRRFRLRSESGRTMRIRVNGATKFEGIAGFGALRRGLAVEVDAKRTDSGLMARQVETRDRNGGGGGADDPPGDDRGSGGNGADDSPRRA